MLYSLCDSSSLKPSMDSPQPIGAGAHRPERMVSRRSNPNIDVSELSIPSLFLDGIYCVCFIINRVGVERLALSKSIKTAHLQCAGIAAIRYTQMVGTVRLELTNLLLPKQAR